MRSKVDPRSRLLCQCIPVKQHLGITGKVLPSIIHPCYAFFLLATYLALETGTIRKKWQGRIPIALLYPNTYPLAVSNLGFQLVYTLLNSIEHIVCERFVYPEQPGPLRSLESGRLLTEYPLLFGSISFEQDFPRLVGMLAAGRIEPMAGNRPETVESGTPMVVLGGVGVFMNPEPLATFADLMIIGEAEQVLKDVVTILSEYHNTDRNTLLTRIAITLQGCYVPSFYSFTYSNDGAVKDIKVKPGIPERIQKVTVSKVDLAPHSTLYSPDAELSMFMAELGRGCSRGCRFCAAGFIYRPPRLWSGEDVVAALDKRPPGVERIGLLGMEMAESITLDSIADYLEQSGCTLSFSSLRADRISDQLLSLLKASRLKSVAIAPDGCSERLRRLINKGLSEEDLLAAAVRLVDGGIYKLKLYVMIGLPTETMDDLDELIALVAKIQSLILPIGRKRGRVSELILSVNSFVPKPWTPFQYCSFGGMAAAKAAILHDQAEAVMALKKKIKYLRKAFASSANLRIKSDNPERVLQQAVYSRGDRRLAPLLLDVGMGLRNFKQALKAHGLSAWQYAIRPRDESEVMCWDIIDHGITPGYLWNEYQRAMDEKITPPCETSSCLRCGVCKGFGFS